jgi:hypothetical protein
MEIKVKDAHNTQKAEYTIQVKSPQGEYEFRADQSKQLTNLLKVVYVDRVKLPFGLFSTRGNKTKII